MSSNVQHAGSGAGTPPPKRDDIAAEDWHAPLGASLLSTPEKMPDASHQLDFDPEAGRAFAGMPKDMEAADMGQAGVGSMPGSGPTWSLQPPPWSRAAEDVQPTPARHLGRSRSLVSPKIGAAAAGKDYGSTRRIREDTEARARSIHQRQQFDTVASLLRGQDPQHSATLVVPQGMYRETSTGRFVCRSHEEGSRCEVEVQLSDGRLVRVLRNPYRRTLTFEGRVIGSQGEDLDQQRLVVQLPSGYDLSSPPVRVERHFDEGHCLVILQEGGRHAAMGASPCRSDGGLPGQSPFQRVHDPLQAECEL